MGSSPTPIPIILVTRRKATWGRYDLTSRSSNPHIFSMQHPTSGMENWTQVISVQTSIEKHYWKQHSNISKGLWFPTPIFFFPWKKAGPTSRNFTLKGFISSASWPWLRACERLGNGVLMGVDLQKILENHGEKTAKMREKLFKNWDAGQQQNRHFDFYHHHQKKKRFHTTLATLTIKPGNGTSDRRTIDYRRVPPGAAGMPSSLTHHKSSEVKV